MKVCRFSAFVWLLVALGAGNTSAQEFWSFGESQPPTVMEPSTRTSISAVGLDAVRLWDGHIQSLIRTGELRTSRIDTNTMLAGHTHERLTQHYRGIPIYGSGVNREIVDGIAVSLSGTVHHDITIDTTPTISTDDVMARLVPAHGNIVPGSLELLVLPNPDDTYSLAYIVDIIDLDGFAIDRVLLDAHTGDVLRRYDAIMTQEGHTAQGQGTQGDTKKLSVTRQPTWNVDLARDSLRPATIDVYDMGFDTARGELHYFDGNSFDDTELASTSAGRTWTDQGVVDTHAYLGWAYDYLYEQFGRQGLDGQNTKIQAMIHWPNPDLMWEFPWMFCNASYNPFNNLIWIGDGLPLDVALEVFGMPCNPLAGAFDVITHELVHGVTATTSNLMYWQESGALDEAFSDILGVSAEFFHAAKGSGLPYPVNYQLGETISPGSPMRDMADPASVFGWNTWDGNKLFSLPNHYASRWLPTDDEWPTDNGWVHINSSIVNHAFYLAVERGTNGRSKQTVNGVGANNRADIEQAFYQAFTYHLTPDSQMRDARYWTIERAPTTAARAAISDAWDAVGLHGDQDVSVSVSGTSGVLGIDTTGHWQVVDPGNTEVCSAGSIAIEIEILNKSPRTFNVSSLYFDQHSSVENQHLRDSTMPPSQFRSFFGTSSIAPYSAVATGLCWVWEQPGIHVSLELDLHGTHTNGTPVPYYAGRWQTFYNGSDY